jgi:defect-in-organelle-trafficking protein DotC
MAVDMPPMSLEQVQSYYAQPAANRADRPRGSVLEDVKAQKLDAQNVRARALIDMGTGIGLRAGIAWQIANINKVIHQNERNLDSVYDFESLMIRQRVVPAVISEARDLYNQDGDLALRLSGAFYRIESQPRFSSVAPNWRAYLTFPPPPPENTVTFNSMLPRDDQERDIWNKAVTDGWMQGVEQANLMLQAGLDRMNRDYTGMLRFRSFVIEGKISMPVIAAESIAVTKEGATMAVDETLLRITTLPAFNAKADAWRGFVVRSSTLPVGGAGKGTQ